MDTVDQKTRGRIMAAIRGKDTKPEMRLRSLLHRAGFRFRLYAKDLPGRPDIVLPKHRAVIQVYGCFWHGHGCGRFQMPATRRRYWAQKIAANKMRDERTEAELVKLGWRVATVWECAVMNTDERTLKTILQRLSKWLSSPRKRIEIAQKAAQS